MTTKHARLIAAIALATSSLAACSRSDEVGSAEPNAHAEKHEPGHAHEREEFARGPHGGRLLREADLALEVTIFETGVPPEFRVYPTRGGKPLDPSRVTLSIELRRLGGKTDAIGFRREADYLLGDRTVEEPHSFDVEVVARWEGKEHRWRYASHEGRVELAAEAAKRSGIVVETVGPARLRTVLELSGKVGANEDRLTHVVARFPGVVKEVRKGLGDRVEKGDTLAVVESNESLRRYDVNSELGGTVIAKHAIVGELAGEDDALSSSPISARSGWI